MTLLEKYKGPEDLKKYTYQELQQLAAEMRELIVEVVSKNGGHLASSLGAVELAIALHAVLDTPQDKVIWDVGHQAYPHKILTGRAAQLSTIRKYKGLSGFPKRGESPYDHFTVGHASTSISLALGLAKARDLNKEDYGVYAVIGDGSLSGGMAMAALNNVCQMRDKNLVVILNDNGMSISKPVGGLSTIITKLRISNFYVNLKIQTEKVLNSMPMVGKSLTRLIEKVVNRTGGIIIHELGKKEIAGFFQDLGFTYVGPVDGHNLPLLMGAIRYAKKFNRGPLLLHVLTKKGKGYAPAEAEPTVFHGPPSFDPETGELKKTGDASKSYTAIFGEEILKAAERDPKVCAITAAMSEGTGLQPFAEKYKDRFFDVGIAEEHAVTFAAGLAGGGQKPVVAVYSTFLQRGYDQVIHDIALQKIPVFFALDRAGLVGEDGPTHHGVFDLSYLRHIPNLIVAAPKDGNELKDMIKTGLAQDLPFAVRYPRGKASFLTSEREAEILPIGKGELVFSDGQPETVVWAVGSMVELAVNAAKRSGKKVSVINARFVKPLDKELLKQTAQKAKKIITIEENVEAGGFGSAILEALEDMNIQVPVKVMALPDKFIEHGSRVKLLADCGLDIESISKEI
jgi:1-deoxy-D-xylulose-5-phosphate synthase